MLPTNRHNRRLEIVAFAYAAWLAGMMLIQFILSGGFVSIATGFALVAIPVALHLWLLGVRPGNGTLGIWYFGLFFFAIFISLMANSEHINTTVLSQAAGLPALVIIGYLLAQQCQAGLLERIFVWFSILLSVVLLIVLIDNDRLWTRLMGRLHANLWAAVAIAAIPGALMIRNKVVAATLIAFVFYMIGFEFNARGPLLYGFAMVVVFMVLWAAYNPNRFFTARLQVAGIVATGIAMFALIANWGYIANEVLFLDSVTRGFGSGFSGRFDLWTSLLRVVADSPLTGVGFRMHVNFVNTPGLISAHNAYIAMLVDLGIPGFTLYMLMIGTALWRTIAIEKRLLLGAYLIGYTLLGLTEARALNVGNPASILFIFTLMTMLTSRGALPKRPGPAGVRHLAYAAQVTAHRGI